MVAIKTKEFVSIGRNDPCPCGGGRKYKRCCLPQVEENIRAIAGIINVPEPLSFPQLDAFVTALGLITGLRPDAHEEPPTPAALLSLFAELLQAFLDAESEEKIAAVHEQLASFLEDTNPGKDLRLDPVRFKELLQSTEVPDSEEDEDYTDEDEEYEKRAAEVLTSLVTPEFIEEAVWQIIAWLRSREVGQEHWKSLLWGLWLALDTNVADNPLWHTLASIAYSEYKAGRAALLDLVEKHQLTRGDWENGLSEEALQDLQEVLAHHPSLEADLSETSWKQIVPALGALSDGTISFSVPPYAVVNALVDMCLASQQTFGVNASPGSPESWLQSLQLQLWDLIRENVWERDYEVFLEEVEKALQAWAEAHAAAEPELAESVDLLLSSLGNGMLRSEQRALELLYLQALGNVLTADPAGGLLSADGLAAYAQELAEGGQPEAAAHVHAAIQRWRQALSEHTAGRVEA